MKSVDKKDARGNITDDYYLLKKFNWLLFKTNKSRDKKGLIFDPERVKEYNHHFRAYLNYYDIRLKLKNIHPELQSLINIWDEFVDLYELNTEETITSSLNSLIIEYEDCQIREINSFMKTVYSWRREIINSFRVIKLDHKIDRDTGQVIVSPKKLNNGIMENRNSILKCIKKNANGYSNWHRFRNRCLYVLRKDAVPMMIPIKKKKR